MVMTGYHEIPVFHRLPAEWRKELAVKDGAGTRRRSRFYTHLTAHEKTGYFLDGVLITLLVCVILLLAGSLGYFTYRARRLRNLGGAPTMTPARVCSKLNRICIIACRWSRQAARSPLQSRTYAHFACVHTLRAEICLLF